ncbi:uncharacterized protein PG998_007781 [Apiospora kogelbergensis]|uniref:Uncharacterized protein n=1 Tax=Apiospora kogelbergensis TaxID=1337665 RepID=A0AAW0QC84_9PEZI
MDPQAEIAKRDARIRQLEEFAKKSEVARIKETYEKIVKDVKKDRDQARQDADEKIKALKAEVDKLRQIKTLTEEVSHLRQSTEGPSSATVTPPKSGRMGDPTTPGTNGDGEMIPMSRAQIEYSERKYTALKEESARQKLQLELLNAQIHADQPSKQFIAVQWNQLRDHVRQLSLERFNEVKPLDTLSKEDERTLEKLSIHYRTFLSTDRMPCYLFRSLIWRLLCDHLFVNFSRVWGPQMCEHLSTMGNALWKRGKISQIEFQRWRMQTARLVHKSYEVDEPTIDEMAAKIHDTMVRFAPSDALKLHDNIREIVRLAADMSSTFARTKVIPMMTNEPRSELTHGFQCNVNTMNEAGQVIKDGKVSLMITPCLLERDGDDYSLLVKADVIS